MAANLSYEMFDDGKLFADYGKSGFNFENCRRYVVLFYRNDLCTVISSET